MPKINSRAKGARNELAFAKFMKEVWGLEARRGQQFSGGKDSPDVIHSLKGVHFEVKAVEKLNLAAAYEQAVKDCEPCGIPIVAHKKNGGSWMITLKAAQLERLSRLLIDSMNMAITNKAGILDKSTSP